MSDAIRVLVDEITELSEGLGRLNFMEVCGTHTVSLFRSGVKSLLPQGVRLISGPGCPVCVTSQAYLDTALRLAARREVIICTYGDMVRVPGRSGSLATARAAGEAQVQVVYSARDALELAANTPDKEVIFLAVGFETTAPATALTLLEARSRGVENFSVLLSHKLVMPALRAVLSAQDSAHSLHGFLCPGHVSVVIGSQAYAPIVREHGLSCVVAGFEPLGMLKAIRSLISAAREGQAVLENCYGVVVRPEGNPHALKAIEQVFVAGDETWRAMGTIAESGLQLRAELSDFDALRRFDEAHGPDYEPPGCRCGEVIQGMIEPPECALFGGPCTPHHPIGPCMVSSEGTCAAWYKYSGVVR